jgi:hypothetical protein
MVLRVPPELPERLTMIQQHLYEETRIEYSYSAIMRGLINLGLTQVEGAPNLAVLFMGARVKRGRKPGSKVATAVVPLDLTQGEMDLEFEDDHNNALGPQPKKGGRRASAGPSTSEPDPRRRPTRTQVR